MGKADAKSAHRNNRNIGLPFSQQIYNANINNASDFRKCIDERIELFPELFPPEITTGYRMKDIGKAEGSGKPRGRILTIKCLFQIFNSLDATLIFSFASIFGNIYEWVYSRNSAKVSFGESGSDMYQSWNASVGLTTTMLLSTSNIMYSLLSQNAEFTRREPNWVVAKGTFNSTVAMKKSRTGFPVECATICSAQPFIFF